MHLTYIPSRKEGSGSSCSTSAVSARDLAPSEELPRRRPVPVRPMSRARPCGRAHDWRATGRRLPHRSGKCSLARVPGELNGFESGSLANCPKLSRAIERATAFEPLFTSVEPTVLRETKAAALFGTAPVPGARRSAPLTRAASAGEGRAVRLDPLGGRSVGAVVDFAGRGTGRNALRHARPVGAALGGSGLGEAEAQLEAAQGRGRPPVPLAEQAHQRGDEEGADDRRVDHHADRHADRDLLDEEDAC